MVAVGRLLLCVVDPRFLTFEDHRDVVGGHEGRQNGLDLSTHLFIFENGVQAYPLNVFTNLVGVLLAHD